MGADAATGYEQRTGSGASSTDRSDPAEVAARPDALRPTSGPAWWSRLGARFEHVLDTRSVPISAWLVRRTHGRITRLWRRRALVLTTRGRRSGLPRTVVVQYFPEGTDLLVVAANSGLDAHPAWFLNLTADPHAVVEVEGRRRPVTAEVVAPDEAGPLWGRVLADAPDYERYRRRTDRVIPLVRLRPVEG